MISRKHPTENHKTEEGEAVRNDKDFMYVSAWEFKGVDNEPTLHKESLDYENIEVKTRNYKEFVTLWCNYKRNEFG